MSRTSAHTPSVRLLVLVVAALAAGVAIRWAVSDEASRHSKTKYDTSEPNGDTGLAEPHPAQPEVLARRQVESRLRIVDKSGQGIPGAQITWFELTHQLDALAAQWPDVDWDRASAGRTTAVTDSAGFVELSAYSQSNSPIAVWVDHTGYRGAQCIIEPEAHTKRINDIVLEQIAPIEVTVCDAAGQGISGAVVEQLDDLSELDTSAGLPAAVRSQNTIIWT